MVGSDLARLAVFAVLPSPAPRPRSSCSRPSPASETPSFALRCSQVSRNLVPAEQLPEANALVQLVDWTTTAAGPLLGGVIVAASGPNLAYWVNAATFALSALLVSGIPGRLLQSERPVGRGRWGDLSEGFAIVRNSRALVCVLVVWSIVMLASGAVNLAEVFSHASATTRAISASACSGRAPASVSCWADWARPR